MENVLRTSIFHLSSCVAVKKNEFSAISPDRHLKKTVFNSLFLSHRFPEEKIKAETNYLRNFSSFVKSCDELF